MRLVFTITIAGGAALLFLVQPLVGKLLLPDLGGSPMVWNTCMVFFQVALLLGYGYAHLLTRVARPGLQVLVHAVMLAAALAGLPIGLRGGLDPTVNAPTVWLLWNLALAVGPAFFIVSTGAPLLQRWFSRTDDPAAGDPYFLYAASNAGSLGALLAYPLLVEPLLPLSLQRVAWSWGFAVFAALTVSCGLVLMARSRPAELAAPADRGLPAETPGLARGLWWALLAFVPSSLMLGVTQQITTDVAAVPMFWVLPLAIYLLTFVLAFARRRVVPPRVAGLALVGCALFVLPSLALWTRVSVGLALVSSLLLLLFAGAACHGRLAEARPHPRHLTVFYLWIAIGGAAGGVFNAIVAPALFADLVEYPLVVVAAVLLRPRWAFRRRRRAWRWAGHLVDVAVVSLAVVQVPTLRRMMDRDEGLLLAERTFFGVHRVRVDGDGRWVEYRNGTTTHGLQDRTAPRTPQSYYHDASGIGRLLDTFAGTARLDRVGVVGLGAGSLAAFGASGQRWTFFEIDPTVVRIARDPALFTFLRDAEAEVDVVLGDGRLSLARQPDGVFGLIVLDAFTSDAIPVHLLTREAIVLYFAKLRRDGLLAANISNRHVDLRPLLAAYADEGGLAIVEWIPPDDVEADLPEGGARDEHGRYAADWIVLARHDAAVALLLKDPGWHVVTAPPDAPTWTDDFSNLLGVMRWWD